MTPFRIACPHCQKPLNVPAGVAGRAMHCPHCLADFTVTASADGTPGEPVLRRSRGATLPRILLGPALGLLLIGSAGLFVNGSLAAEFARDPDADLRYAGALVRNVQSIESAQRPGATDETWQEIGHAALAGSATAVGSTPTLQALRAEQLARSWRTGVVPVNTASVILSLLTTLGAVATLLGRGYAIALVGCVAAALNVNHLCCLPGGLIGLWCLLALVRDEGRAHFGIAPRPTVGR